MRRGPMRLARSPIFGTMFEGRLLAALARRDLLARAMHLVEKGPPGDFALGKYGPERKDVVLTEVKREGWRRK